MTASPSPGHGGAVSAAGAHTPASRAGLRTAVLLGAGCFAVVALLGQAIAFVVWLVSSRELSLGAAARLGWLYVGAFHHVPIVVRLPELDVGALIGGVTPGSALPTTGSASGELGVALLLVTGTVAWLLFRAGRRAAVAGEVGPLPGALLGLGVALAYALPMLAVSSLVHLRADLAFGTLATGRLDARLALGPAFLLPFLLAAVAAGAGGFAEGARAIPGDRTRRALGALAGGWRMLLLGLGISLAGLFVVGAVQPEGPAARLTPSTASYFRAVFDRPTVGFVVLAHHIALAPNEALWTLVPAMGGCDGASDSISGTFLCYGRFPGSVTLPGIGAGGSSTLAPGRTEFGTAPPLYFFFLLVPAAAAFWGGRHGASRARPRSRREAAAVGAASGVVFAGLVGAVGALSAISVRYSADFEGQGGSGSVRAGPFLLSGMLLALAWGVVFGWLGARTGRRMFSDGAPEQPGPVSRS